MPFRQQGGEPVVTPRNGSPRATAEAPREGSGRRVPLTFGKGARDARAAEAPRSAVPDGISGPMLQTFVSASSFPEGWQPCLGRPVLAHPPSRSKGAVAAGQPPRREGTPPGGGRVGLPRARQAPLGLIHATQAHRVPVGTPPEGRCRRHGNGGPGKPSDAIGRGGGGGQATQLAEPGLARASSARATRFSMVSTSRGCGDGRPTR